MIEILDWPYKDLGNSPSSGKEGVDECQRFKTLIRFILRYISWREPADAYFETVERDGHRGLICRYNPNDARALEYAEAAESRAPAAWALAESAKKMLQNMRER